MKAKTKFSQKILSVFLSIVLLLSVLPLSVLTASAAQAQLEDNSGITRYADPSTMDGWKEFIYQDADHFNTANAGGIWTDKSVFTDNSEFTALGIDGINNPSERGFLTSLSAIGSNMTITGQSAVATDTVMVLDTSGSMTAAAVISMVEAANISIASLMDANINNRVAVVFYSNSATTFLPLDHYTTGDDDIYLTTSTGTSISLDNSVRNSNNSLPYANNRSISGGTYMARGLHQALSVFDNATLDQTNTPRKPVIMFMTDGAPTRADTDFSNPPASGNNDLGDGQYTDEPIVFATELAASYVKEKVTKTYGENYKCLFYTLGMGVSTDEDEVYSESVLDPENKNTTAINTLWTNYKNAASGTPVVIDTVTTGPWWNQETVDITVSKLESPTLSEKYVDRYFSAASEDDLVDAFEKVLTDIALQTTYYPTLVSGGDAKHSGYISFVDKVGRYMQVSKINGLIINDKLYTGSHFAAAFNEGDLGTATNPTDLGDNLIWSIKQRLNIEADIARAIMGSAYQAGQIYYNSESDFSNYFGWYSNDNNEFLGFYSEGSAVPAGAVWKNKSYLFLGEEDALTDIHASDMMYATVRVREKITTGEQEVAFAVPASLVPTVTYNVELDVNGDVKALTTNAASIKPIRLVYETALDSRINKWTAGEIVDDTYTDYTSPVNGNNFTVNSDGSINFYNNKWDFDGDTGYGTYNPYSYFRPATQNDRHYFQYDTPIFTFDGTNYIRYNGAEMPSGEGYYYGSTVYYKDGGNVGARTDYHQLRPVMLAASKQNSDGWYIPESYIRQDYVDVELEKPKSAQEATGNLSGTLPYYAKPYNDFTDGAGNASHKAEGHYLVVGTTLGNNGKITLAAENGIKINKTLEAGINADPNKDFIFEITSSVKEAKSREAYKIDAQGVGSATSVVFNSEGKATVSLKANETIYIGDMSKGDNIKVTEVIDTEYILKSLVINNDGSSVIDNDLTADVTLDTLDMPEMVFTNGIREKGSVTISKRITHPYGANYTIPSTARFEVKLTFTFDNKPLKGYTIIDSGVAEAQTTDDSGVYTLKNNIGHNESRLISGIPVGTVVTVVEDVPTGFSATYNGQQSSELTINETNQNVEIINNYEPNSASAAEIKVSAEKTFSRAWKSGDSFTFYVQELINDNWVTLSNSAATKTIAVTDSNEYKDFIGTQDPISFEFTNVFENIEYTIPGTYYYRVYEKPEAIAGVNYDTRPHGFIVTVKDDKMDGALKIESVVASTSSTATVSVEDSYKVTAKFLNEYNPDDAVANFELNKLVENKTGSPLGENKLGGYTFQIAEADSSFAQTGDWQDITGETSSSGILKHTITYDEIGNHYYLIKEVVPSELPAGWTYDTELKKVVVEITDNGGALLATTYINGNKTNASNSTVVIDFTNKYEPTSDEIVIIDDELTTSVRTDFIRKNLTGRALKGGEFTFNIYDEDSPLAVKPVIRTGTNEAANAGESAQINFNDNLEFSQVGEFHYSVAEVKASINGITYDEQKYYFTVTVTDNGEGALVAEIIVEDGIDTSNIITFNNSYDAEDEKLSLTAQKNLKDKELIANAFTFYIQECDQNGQPLENTTPSVAYNQKNGEIVFPEFTYTKTGVAHYLIWEYIPDGEKLGITYDATKFIATVEIIDDTTNAVLKSNVTYKKKAATDTEWSTADAIVFNNSYAAAATSVTFTGGKTVEGMKLTADEYSFELYESNSSWTEGELLDTKKNGAPDSSNTGYFTFKKLDLDTAKEYHFIVKEVIPEVQNAKKGITYDTTKYYISVTVTDNSRGQLIKEISIQTNTGIPKDNILFTNRYAPIDGTGAEFEGNKILDKDDGTKVEFTDFTFTFELFETDSSFIVSGTDSTTVDADENGKFKFETEYNADDLGKTFFYVIREKDNEHGGITYSKEEYRVTVKVVDEDYDGAVETQIEITNKAGKPIKADEIEFINKYSIVNNDKFDISGKKNLSGRDLAANEFKFDIYQSNNLFNLEIKLIKSAYNNADGSFSIKDIPITKEGIHYFIVKEDDSASIAKAGVSYDQNKYYVTVTAIDNKDGTLSITDTKIVNAKDASEDIEILEFNNTYTPPVKDDTAKSPQTGDNTNFHLWIALLFVSTIGLTGIGIYGKRKKD